MVYMRVWEVYPPWYMQGILPMYTPGIPPCIYTSIPPWVHLLYVRLPYPGCPVCSMAKRQGPGLNPGNNKGTRRIELSLLPKV